MREKEFGNDSALLIFLSLSDDSHTIRHKHTHTHTQIHTHGANESDIPCIKKNKQLFHTNVGEFRSQVLTFCNVTSCCRNEKKGIRLKTLSNVSSRHSLCIFWYVLISLLFGCEESAVRGLGNARDSFKIPQPND